MKQSGIWKAVMSIHNNINDFSCASGKDRKRTDTARGLYSKQRPVFVNFVTTWSNINTTFHYRVKIATPGAGIL